MLGQKDPALHSSLLQRKTVYLPYWLLAVFRRAENIAVMSDNIIVISFLGF